MAILDPKDRMVEELAMLYSVSACFGLDRKGSNISSTSVLQDVKKLIKDTQKIPYEVGFSLGRL